MKLKSALFKLIPESMFKKRVRCFFYNRSQDYFRIKYEDGMYQHQLGDIHLQFLQNTFYNVLTDRDYLLKQQIQPGDTVIDGGAFWGTFSVLASKLVGPEGKVIAFEPDPVIANILRKNAEVNKATNVEVIEKGLWSEETVLHFEHGKELGSKFIPGANDSPGLIKVPVTTIDAVMKDRQVKNKLFIKMNIEGSEIEAIKGAANTIRKYSPHFVIRTDHYVDGELTFKRVEQGLEAMGYTHETLQLNDLTTFGFPKAAQ